MHPPAGAFLKGNDTKKEKFKKDDWEEKKNWIKKQLQKMDCDIVGFQEVFSQEELKELVLECGFKEFVVTQNPKLDEKNKVYTPESSLIYGLATTKKGAEAPEISHLVRVRRL